MRHNESHSVECIRLLHGDLVVSQLYAGINPVRNIILQLVERI